MGRYHMFITTLLIGLSALYLLTYGSGKEASVEEPSDYPASLGGKHANTGDRQEQYHQRSSVDTNMIATFKDATYSEQPLDDGSFSD